MTTARRIRVVIFFALLALALGLALKPRLMRSPRIRHLLHPHSTPIADRMGLPPVMFWAWERPEDLRFLDPHEAGVVFLARSIYLQPRAAADDPGQGMALRPRMQPLHVSPETPLMAVVRIEVLPGKHTEAEDTGSASDTAAPAHPFSDAQRKRAVGLIIEAAHLPGVRALQIDFDATLSQQSFYHALLQDVRAELPQGMPLSITALASWCVGDSWLEELPKGTIDEAVPMLFRLGVGSRNFAAFLQTGQDFSVPLCRGSLGVSTDEVFSQQILSGTSKTPDSWHARRIYIFPAHALTAETAAGIFIRLRSWR
jgi:hypothetical protein